MRTLVFVCGALLVLAILFVLLSTGPYPDAFLQLLRSPRPTEIAWIAIAVVSLIVLAAAFWSTEQLHRQRNVAEMLESRLRLEQAQKDVDLAAHELGRTVSDSAMRDLQERLSKAEQELAARQHRSEVSELQARVEEIRARQDALKEKLGEAVTKRKSIEQLFTEYEATQQDIDRTLSGVEVDPQGDSIDRRIGSLSQFTKLTESRFKELEQARQLLLDLGKEFGALQARLVPLEDERGGIKALIHRLNDMEAQLGGSIDTLERDGDVRLAERIKRITETRQELSQRIAGLAEELSKLDHSHKDINSLFTRLSSELRTRSSSDIDAHELTANRQHLAPLAPDHRSDIEQR
jgi:chromosome segregation ATPase